MTPPPNWPPSARGGTAGRGPTSPRHRRRLPSRRHRRRPGQGWQRVPRPPPSPHGELPETLTARTGGGGLHLVYAHPGAELRNTAGRLPGVAEPLSGVDLRGDGGYVVAAPQPPPQRQRLRLGRPPGGPGPGMAAGAQRRALPAGRRALPPAAPRPGSFPLRARSLGRRGVRRPPGARQRPQQPPHRAAFCLGMLVAGGELAEARVEDELLAAAVDAGLPEDEARAASAAGSAPVLRSPAGAQPAEPARFPQAPKGGQDPCSTPPPEQHRAPAARGGPQADGLGGDGAPARGVVTAKGRRPTLPITVT